MKRLACVIVMSMLLCAQAQAGSVLFDFNNGPLHASLPLDLTVGGITAHFSATGQGFSIQDTAQVIGVLPTGFSGFGLVPNSISSADLLVSFPQERVTDFSIKVAPQELNTDSTATLRVTAFMNGIFAGTNTSKGSEPFFWPPSTLSFISPQGFNSVVVHYDSPPPTGGDFGRIFVADNMIVTAQSSVVPEPSSLGLLGVGALGLLVCPWLRRWILPPRP
jgi:PEP-CTERM motif-containing protein